MIAFQSVTKFPGDNPKRPPILADADFVVEKGQTVGVLVKRGAGRSTIAGLINGNVKPNRGAVVHGMSVSWPIASRQIFNKALTLRANIRFLAELYGAWPPEMIEAVASMANLRRQDLDKPVVKLPDELHNRSVVSLCLALDFDCYVADENLFLGNRAFRDYVQQRFADMKGEKSLAIVTGKVQFIRDFCDAAYVLQSGSLKSYSRKGEAIRDFKRAEQPGAEADAEGEDSEDLE
ncbi:hypothetical protein [Methylocella sp.]|uniref:hypothetical protein n=1 Tax=Methylocella sp. TaxID=1978226 RepID=UPI00378422D1